MKAAIQAAERQVEGFIGRFDLKNAALIRAVRQALQKRRPSANELVYDNYNFFVIGYCSTERPSDCIVSMAAAANGVGLSFYYGATLPDPHKLLLGSGSQNRFIRLESAETLARPEVEELIAAANWFLRSNKFNPAWLAASTSVPRLIAMSLLAGNWYAIVAGMGNSAISVLWSISVEEQFYAIWPSVFRVLKGPKFVIFAGAACVTSLVATFLIASR